MYKCFSVVLCVRVWESSGGNVIAIISFLLVSHQGPVPTFGGWSWPRPLLSFVVSLKHSVING